MRLLGQLNAQLEAGRVLKVPFKRMIKGRGGLHKMETKLIMQTVAFTFNIIIIFLFYIRSRVYVRTT